MPAVAPEANVAARAMIRRDLDRLETQKPNLKDLFENHAYENYEPIRLVPAPKAQVAFENELSEAIARNAPKSTKSGVNGSFFIIGRDGRNLAVFKPMSMETGMPGNLRMARGQNVQFRETILPGQGAGNEVIAYYLDHHGLAGHYGISQTILINIRHPAMGQQLELGSAQRFVQGAKPLANMTAQEIDLIPQREWEKLNFRLISGSTDAHFGNILFCPQSQTIHLIDSGDDFVGAAGQYQYYNPWVSCVRSYRPMLAAEYQFLANIDLNAAMTAFERAAKSNEQASGMLRVSKDKYLTQMLRLYLARTVGKYCLTQWEWCNIMSPKKMPSGQFVSSDIQRIYNTWILPHQNRYSDWKQVVAVVNWNKVVEELNFVAKSYVIRRIDL